MDNIKELLFNHDPEIVITGLDQLTYFFDEELAKEILGDTHFDESGQLIFSETTLKIPAETRTRVALFLMSNLEHESLQKQDTLKLFEHEFNPCPSFSLPEVQELIWSVNMTNDAIEVVEDTVWDLNNLKKIRIYDSNLTHHSHITQDFIDTHTQDVLHGGLSRIPYIEAENIKTLECSPSWSMEGLDSYQGIEKLVFGCMLDSDVPVHSSFSQKDDDSDIEIINEFLAQNPLKELVVSRISNRFHEIQLPDSLESLTICGRIESLTMLEQLSNLKSLTLFYCPNLVEISSLFQLEQLEKLYINFGDSPMFPITGLIWEESTQLHINLENKEQVQRFFELLQFFYDCHHEEETTLPNQGDILYLGDNTLLEDLSMALVHEEHSNIQEINLRKATSLTRIHLPTMSSVKKVVLSHCTAFSDLQSLSCFPNLERLVLNSCRLQNLDLLPKLPNLIEIDISATPISNIDGLKNCPNLQIFRAEGLHQLVDLKPLESLQALEEIYVANNSLQHLHGLQTLRHLKKIDLRNSENLKSLSGCPDTDVEEILISDCPKLYSLDDMPTITTTKIEIINNPNLENIEGLLKSTSLEEITFQGCTALNNIYPLQKLPNLSTLILGTHPYEDQRWESFLINTPEDFQKLYDKNIADFKLFEQVSQYREKLKKINLEDIFPFWDQLVEIKNKYFYRKLLEGTSLNSEGEFVTWSDHYTYIKDFVLFQLYSMAEHPDFMNTEQIRLSSADGLQNLNPLKNAKKLNHFDICSKTLTDISGLRDVPAFIGSCYKNTGVYLSNCPKLQDFSPLKDLNIQWFFGMQNPYPVDISLFRTSEEGKGLYQLNLSNTGIDSLKHLDRHEYLCALELNRCQNLTSLEGFHGDGSQIIRVELYGCIKLESLDGLQGIGNRYNFDGLEIRGCSSLTDISALENYRQKTLDFTDCHSLEDISVLSTCSNLQVLKVQKCNSLQDISPLKGHPTLEEIYAQNTKIGDISVLSTIANLKKVVISTSQNGTHLQSLSQCPLLEEAVILGPEQTGHEILSELGHLKVLGCNGLSDIALLPESESIETLYLYNATITDLKGISKLPNLRKLYLNGSHSIIDFSGINQLKKLQVLHLPKKSPTLKGLSSYELKDDEIKSLLQSIQLTFNLEQGLEITDSPDILFLEIPGRSYVTNLQFLTKLPNLKKLDIRNCTNLTSLEGLQFHPNLENIFISDCTKLKDLSALATLYKLDVSSIDVKNIGIEDLNSIKDIFKSKEKTSLPEPNLEVRKWLAKARFRTFDLNRDYRSTNHCTNLKLEACLSLENIDAIYDTQLSQLNINNCVHIKSVDALLGVQKTLSKLDARHVQFDFDFSHFENLEHLLIRGNHKFRHFHTLHNIPKLDTLSIGPNKYLEDLDFLEPLKQLRFLAISNLSAIKDITGLHFFSKDTRVYPEYKYNTTQILHFYDDESEEICRIPGGIKVDGMMLHNWPRLKSLDGLLSISSLKELELARMPLLQSVSALLQISDLEKVTIHQNVGSFQSQTLRNKSEIHYFVQSCQDTPATTMIKEIEVFMLDNSVTTIQEVLKVLKLIFNITYDSSQLINDAAQDGGLDLGRFTYAKAEQMKQNWIQYKQNINSVLEIEWRDLELDFESIMKGFDESFQKTAYKDVHRLIKKALQNFESEPTDEKYVQIQKGFHKYSAQVDQETTSEAYVMLSQKIIATYTKIYGQEDSKTIQFQIDIIRNFNLRDLNEQALELSQFLIDQSYKENVIHTDNMSIANRHSLANLYIGNYDVAEKWNIIARDLAHKLEDQHLNVLQLNLGFVYLLKRDVRCLDIFEAAAHKFTYDRSFLKYWPLLGKSLYTSMETESWLEPEMILDQLKSEFQDVWRFSMGHRWIDRCKNIVIQTKKDTSEES